MKRRIATALGVFGAVIALSAPVLFSLQLSRSQAIDAEMNRALGIARSALQRSEQTSNQLGAALAKLTALGSDNGCSPAHLTTMRRIDLGFSAVQIVGHVAGNRLVCSSIDASSEDGLDLGPPDLVTAGGARIRNAVEFPYTPGDRFIVVEHNGFAGIVHTGDVLGAADDTDPGAIGVFTRENQRFVTTRGNPEPAWANVAVPDEETSFIDGQHIVGIVHSLRYPIGAVAAVPIAGVEALTRDFARTLLPIGAFAGLLMTLALLYLLRTQQDMSVVLRSALRRNEFFLAYQPVVDMQSGRCVGAEALLRWRNRDGELIPPDIFIPFAEQSGQIGALTQRLIELLHKDLKGFFTQHRDFRISLNLSPHDLSRASTHERLQALVRATGAQRGNLVAEITEHSLLETERAREIVTQLRNEGVLIAIDDFGTGYSSLSVLQRLQLDYLKIDRSFIETVATEAPTSQVVQHIIEMGRTLGLEMVAEGVETREQAEYLLLNGVRFAQGWLYGQPVSFADLMTSQRARRLRA